jgi:hypothetical protein
MNSFYWSLLCIKRMSFDCVMKNVVRNTEQMMRLNENFITILWNLWKMKYMKTFFKDLKIMCPEFDSKNTCWILLERVVWEYMRNIYNATTRSYHNGQLCANPLQIFFEYVISREVFKFRK